MDINMIDLSNNNDDVIGYIDKNKVKGSILENNIKDILIDKLSDIYMKILSNVVIYDLSTDEMTEIDLLLLTTSGIYTIECKNWSGTIYGTVDDNTWTQFFNKDERTNKYYNPIKQNVHHIDFLMKYLNIEKNRFRSYIVFPDKTNIKYLEAVNSNNNYIKILKINNLIDEILNDLRNDEILLSHEEIEKIYIKVKNFDIEEIKKYVETIKE